MIIVIQCRDQVGLVAAISGALAEEQLNIVSLREHVDKAENRFFIRLEVDQDLRDGWLEQKLASLLPPDAIIAINPPAGRKIVVLVTREYHCLADILIRNYFKTLGASILCVIGNHPVLQDICERFNIPFHFVPREPPAPSDPSGPAVLVSGPASSRSASAVNASSGPASANTYPARQTAIFEQKISALINRYGPDYIVLAKFMRILSPAFVSAFATRIINIHHSFLPAFAGASPYRQAFERGVKLIGATAHFVTNELDEGPIIAQQIIPVTHSFTVTDMVRAGKEIETAVLANALRLVMEDRVLVYRNKTVVFE